MFVSLDAVGIKRVPLEDTSRTLFSDLGLEYPGGASKGRGWSSQQTLQTCPHLFKRTYVDGVRGGSKAMDVGSMVHLALAVRHLRMMDPAYPLTTAMLFEHMLARTDSHGKEILEARRLMDAYEFNYENDYYDRIISVEESYTSPTGDSCRWDYIAEVNASSGLFPGIYVSDAKCLRGDAVITDYRDGQRNTIAEFARQGVGPLVLAYDANGRLARAQATAPVSNGIRDIFGVGLKSGRKLAASGNHPFMTARGWVRADQLTNTDWIAVPNTTAGVETSAFTDDEVRFVGYMLGDGYLGQKLTFTQTPGPVLEDFKRTATAIGTTWRIESIDDEARPPSVVMSLKPSDPAVMLIDRLKLRGKLAVNKKIPDELHEITDRQVEILIGALWATDGTVNVVNETRRTPKTSEQRRRRSTASASQHVHISYTSRSRELCAGIQTLLLRLGFDSTICMSSVVYDGARRPVAHLAIVGRECKRKFLQSIIDGRIRLLKYNVGDAHTALLPDDDRRIPTTRILKSIALAEMPAVMRLRVRYAHSLTAFSLESQKLDSKCTPEVAAKIDAILAEPIIWDRVKTVLVEGRAETFDITVPGVENFVANDIITHNTASRFDAATTDGWSNNGELLGEMMHYIDGGFEQKYGPLRGLIVDIIGKQKDPQFMRIVLPVNMTLIDQHRDELKKWNAMRDFYAAANFWPRARGNCIGQYGKCQRYDECADLAC